MSSELRGVQPLNALQDKLLHTGPHDAASALRARVSDLEGVVRSMEANAWYDGNRIRELQSRNEELDAELSVYTTLLSGEKPCPPVLNA